MRKADDVAILVIGIGNEYRRDDAVGLAVARALQPPPDGVRVIQETGEGTALMEAWKGAGVVILIDAVHSGREPGTVHRLDAQDQQIPPAFFSYSTHALSVPEAVELARNLGQLPAQLLIFGIEGKDFSAGTGLSPEVAMAAIDVERNVRDEISRCFGQIGCDILQARLASSASPTNQS